MSSIPVAESSGSGEQEQGYWRFTALGLGWTAKGVIFFAVAVLVMALMFCTSVASKMPQDPGVNPGDFKSVALIYQFMNICSSACVMLGLLLVPIGLLVCMFIPKPTLARIFCLGALLLFGWSQYSSIITILEIMSYSSFRETMIESSRGMLFEMFDSFFLSTVAYFFSIAFGSCYLLTIANTFRDQELSRKTQGFLWQLMALPVATYALLSIMNMIVKAKHWTDYWVPLTSFALLCVLYLWLSYCLIKLLFHAQETISRVVDPNYQRRPGPYAKATPIIDPLAD